MHTSARHCPCHDIVYHNAEAAVHFTIKHADWPRLQNIKEAK
jgi:hypothetical protein